MSKAALVAGFVFLCISALETPASADNFADCDAKSKTILDMEICAGAERDRAYAELDAAHKNLLAKVTAKGQKKLNDARTAWEEYSKKQCAFETSGSEDAREHTLFIVLCYASMAHDYAKKLTAQLHCPEGDLACGGQ